MSRLQSPATQSRFDRIDRRRRARIDWQYWPDIIAQLQYTKKSYDLDIASRPDVEDEALVAWGLAHSEGKQALDVKIDVLFGKGEKLSKFQRLLETII